MPMVLPHLLLDRPTRFPEARAVPTAAMGVGIGRYRGKSPGEHVDVAGAGRCPCPGHHRSAAPDGKAVGSAG